MPNHDDFALVASIVNRALELHPNLMQGAAEGLERMTILKEFWRAEFAGAGSTRHGKSSRTRKVAIEMAREAMQEMRQSFEKVDAHRKGRREGRAQQEA